MGNLSKHIVLIGLNFYLQHHPGDKNFWINLIPLLAIHLDRITIFSIRENLVSTEQYVVNDCQVLIRYLTPKFLEIGDVKRTKMFWCKGRLLNLMWVMERVLNTKKICSELRKLYRKNPYDYIHLMDNFGFANRPIAKDAPTPVSVSAIGYQGINKLFYDNYLRLSYNHPNLEVIPYSLAYAKKLKQIGVHENHIKHIRWGVKLPEQRLKAEKKRELKISLSLPPEKLLFVWAGYIQQIQKKDFLYAIKIAKEALNNNFNGIFFFAFKPKHFDKKVVSFCNPEKGIFIRETSTKEFGLLKQIADIFYSPVVNKNSILAPPLTWIEFLSFGIPILTTNAGGADEVVTHGKTGYIAKSNNELIKKMFIIAERYKEMIPYCHDKVFTLYNIENTAKEYLTLWYG